MKDKLTSFAINLKSAKGINLSDEQATKQGIILKILYILGWDIFDTKEVYPEYALKSQRVDYSLRIDKSNKVFIEAKRISEELESHQEQLLKYSFQAGVSLAILTNGLSWWFYLPLMKDANWEERKFYTIDLIEQDPERIADKFIDLFSKDNIISGQAIKNAEATHESQQKKKIVAEALPKAWNKIILELENPLVNFLMETTENLCGHRVGYALAKQFIASNKGNLTLSEKLIKKDTSIPVKKPPKGQTSSSRTAQILAFLKEKCPGVKAEHIGLLIEIDKKHRFTFNVDWEHTGREFLVFGKSGRRNKPANELKEVFGDKFTEYGNIARRKGKFVDISKPSKEEIACYTDVEQHVWELKKQGLIYSPPKLYISVSKKTGTYFDSMDVRKQRQVEKNILQRRELWEVFLRNKKITNADFKKYSKFKKKGTSGFSHFLTQNGIAQRSGGVLTLNKDVIPQIEELLRKYKS